MSTRSPITYHPDQPPTREIERDEQGWYACNQVYFPCSTLSTAQHEVSPDDCYACGVRMCDHILNCPNCGMHRWNSGGEDFTDQEIQEHLLKRSPIGGKTPYAYASQYVDYYDDLDIGEDIDLFDFEE